MYCLYILDLQEKFQVGNDNIRSLLLMNEANLALQLSIIGLVGRVLIIGPNPAFFEYNCF